MSENKLNNDFKEWANELLENNEPAEVLAAVLQLSFEKIKS